MKNLNEIKPALTVEEWERGTFSPSHWGLVAHTENELSVRCPDNREIFVGEDRAKLAAFCLKGQPFGFTREMVDALKDALSSSECDVKEGRLAGSAVDCIEALLPPEEE